MAEISEYEVIRDIFNDIFDMQKRYMYCYLDDYRWEYFLQETEDKSAKYKEYGADIWKLYRSMVMAIITYKEQQQKEIKAKMGALDAGKPVNRPVKKGE